MNRIGRLCIPSVQFPDLLPDGTPPSRWCAFDDRYFFGAGLEPREICDIWSDNRITIDKISHTMYANSTYREEETFIYQLEMILSALDNPGDPSNEVHVVVLDFEANGLLFPYKDSPTGSLTPSLSTIHCCAYWSSEDPSGLVKLQVINTNNRVINIPNPRGLPTVYIAHNGLSFDRFLMQNSFVRMLDTKILAQLLRRDPQQSVSLKNLAECLAPSFLKGDFRGPWDKYTQDMGDYCKQDVRALVEVTKVLLAGTSHNFFNPIAMGRYKLLPAYLLEKNIATILVLMGANGVGFDTKRAIKMLSDRTATMTNIEAELQKIFPPIITQRISSKTGKTLKPLVTIFNPGSRQHIAERLADKYQWTPTDFTPTGQPVVDEEVLSKLAYPEAKMLTQYFQYQKDNGFLNDWITRANLGNGFIYHYCNPSGTISWRCAHNNPNLGQVNKTSEFRELFCGDVSSYSFGGLYGADLSNLEFRILGHYLFPYDEGKFAKIVHTEDLHSANAVSFQFAKDLSEAGKGSRARELAKVCGFAILYGAGTPRIMEITGCSFNEAKQYIDNFKTNTKGLSNLLSDLQSIAVLNNAVRGLDGRPLLVRSTHAALNNVLQGGGAIVAKHWMCNIFELVNRQTGYYSLKPVLFIHDEVQFMMDPWDTTHILPKYEEIDEAIWNKIINKACELVTSTLHLNIPIAAEAHMGPNWGKTH